MRRLLITSNTPLFPLRFFLVLILLFSLSCNNETGYTSVDFSKIVKVDRTESRYDENTGLRVAVAAMVSPKETVVHYRELLDYLGRKLERRVHLIQRKTYGEINELFVERQLDLGFICSGPYTGGDQEYGFEVLAIPQVNGSNFYQSYLIVHKDSRFQNLENLRGGTFAFTDPESNTGRLVPVYWLLQQRETPDIFFKKSIYTYSHDNSILAVARKLVDGAAVDGHIWEYYNRRDPVDTSKTRIIRKSESFGNPPVVASTYLSGKVKERIRQALFSMHLSSDGKRILAELMIDRFIVPKETWYDPIRRMKQTLSLSEKTTHANAKLKK